MDRFRDRRDAGVRLGRLLSGYAGRGDVVVLGLSRGGVAVAAEVARALDAPLDVLVVRVVGVPGCEEVAMGAIASGGIQVLDRYVTRQLGLTPAQLRQVVDRETRELERLERALRGDRAPLDVAGQTVIVVDDGLATGSTMLAAITALRVRGAARIAIAVPVGAREIARALATHADAMHCLVEPVDLEAVADWYDDFAPLSDEEIRALLRPRTEVPHGVHPPGHHQHGDAAPGRPH